MRLMLQTKVAFGVALIVGVALATAGWVSFLTVRREHLDGLEQRSLALSRAMVHRNQEMLSLLPVDIVAQGLASDVGLLKAANPDLAAALVADPGGKILAHADPTRVGQAVDASLQPALGRPQPSTIVGTQAVYTVVPVLKDGRPVFALVVGYPAALIRAKGREIVWWSLAVGGILTVLGSFAATVVVRRWVLGPVAALSAAAQDVAAGRLGHDLRPRGVDEVGRLEGAFARMVEGLRGLVTAVGDGADQVAGAARGIAGTAAQAAKGAEEGAAAVEEITATMHEVNANIGAVAGHAGGAAASVTETGAAIEQLAAAVDRIASMAEEQTRLGDRVRAIMERQLAIRTEAWSTVHATGDRSARLAESIRALGDKARDIDAIVEVIDDLAEQTNLLALNAAIEAARAGEHGAGFAVVAEEVRRLAERSAGSAKEIGGLIRGIQGEAEAAAARMQDTTTALGEALAKSAKAAEAREEMEQGVAAILVQAQQIQAATAEQRQGSREIATAAGRLTELVTEIRAASEEQSAGTAQTVKALEKIREVAAGHAATAAELSASAAQLSSQAGFLQELVSRFQTGDADRAAGAPEGGAEPGRGRPFEGGHPSLSSGGTERGLGAGANGGTPPARPPFPGHSAAAPLQAAGRDGGGFRLEPRP